MASLISETTRSNKEPYLDGREVSEWLEFHVLPIKYVPGTMNEMENCRDATASFSLSRDLVFGSELHHLVGGELLDSTLPLLDFLPS